VLREFELWRSELTVNVYNKVSGNLIPNSNITLYTSSYNTADVLADGTETYYLRNEDYTINSTATGYSINSTNGTLEIGDTISASVYLTPIYNITVFRENTLEPFNFTQQIGDGYSCNETSYRDNITTQKLAALQECVGNFTYDHPCEYGYDDDWNTFSLPNATLDGNTTLTFIKEDNSTNTSYLKVQSSQSINSTYFMYDYNDCWDSNNNTFIVYLESSNTRTYMYCDNASSKLLMNTFENGGALYEAQMFFNHEIDKVIEGLCYDTDPININMIVNCPDRKIETTITESNFNSSIINCDYDYIQFSIFYEESQLGYYRSLIPDKDNGSFNVYMLEQDREVPVEIGIAVYDVSGEYSESGSIRAYTRKDEGKILVVDQPLDQENKVVLYLEENVIYTICSVNDFGVEACHRDLKADVAREIPLTIPEQAIGGSGTDEKVEVQYDVDSEFGIISIDYTDSYSATESISWILYDNDTGVIVKNVTYRKNIANDNVTLSNGIIILTMTGLNNTKNYDSDFTALRGDYDAVSQFRLIQFTFNNIVFTGFEGEEVCYSKTKTINGVVESLVVCKDKNSEMLKAFIACLVPILLILIFSRASAAIGLVAGTAFAIMFQSLGWLWYFNTVLSGATWYFIGLYGLLTLMAAISVYNEAGRRV